MNEQTSPEFIALQEALAGRYSLGRELGRGGMGIVYLAHEVALDRPVALKQLPPHMAGDPALRERFLREARTAAKLSHPNIVPIHAVDEVEDFVFFAMAYIDGDTLGQRIRDRGPMSQTDAVQLLREIAWALAYAHLHGVVHRDVKPDNILIETESGRALVTDFGIAHLHEGTAMTGVGEIIGTAEFMSPEQAAGEPVDARSDIYSLGVLGYYTLTGTLPFEGDSIQAILAKHLTQPAPPVRSVVPEVPLSLAQAIDRCLLKDPGDRYANGDELAAALGSTDKPQEMPVPLRLFVRLSRDLSRVTVPAVLLGSAVFLLGADAGWGTGVAVLGGALATGPFFFALSVARRALRAGFTHEEAVEALAQEHTRAREEGAFEVGRRPQLLEKVSRFVAVTSLASFAGGIGLAVLGMPAADLLIVPAIPVGVLSSAIALQRYDRRNDIMGKLRVKGWRGIIGKAFFKLASLTTRKRLAGAAPTHQRTELAIGMAADRLFEELPKAVRKGLRELPSVVTRLETDARNMRNRVEQLDKLLADVGGAQGGTGSRSKALPGLTAERDALAEDMKQAREVARTRLEDAVTPLETVRLDLLRMHAGSGSQTGVTANLSKARELSDDIARLLEGQEEVEQALKQIDVEV